VSLALNPPYSAKNNYPNADRLKAGTTHKGVNAPPP